MAKVILDPGHGGRDIGDYYEHRSEKNDNLMLALRVGQFLEIQGVEVAFTRNTDIYLSMIERITLFKESKGDLIVTFHHLYGKSYPNTFGSDFFFKETDNDISIPSLMLGIGYVGSACDYRLYNLNYIAIAEAIAVGILKFLTQYTGNKCNLMLKPMSAGYRYRVITGRHRSYDEAAAEQLNLRSLGILADIEFSGSGYVICAGLSNQLDEAVLLEGRLRKLGYWTMIIIV